MKTILSIIIILIISGCKAETSNDDYSEDMTRIQIGLIRDKCDNMENDIQQHDDCMREYAEALTTALSEYINVEIYKAND